MTDLKGQTAVVFGLANKRSIAWAIAQKLTAAGARLAICYQNERLRLEAEALASELPDAAVFQCDVSSDEADRSSLCAAEGAVWQAQYPGALGCVRSGRMNCRTISVDQPRRVSASRTMSVCIR